MLNRFPTGTGYWSNRGFIWLKEPLSLPDNVIQDFIARDLALDLDLDQAVVLIYYTSVQRGISKRVRNEIERIIDSYLDIYITLVILEERRKGRLAAWKASSSSKSAYNRMPESHNSIQ